MVLHSIPAPSAWGPSGTPASHSSNWEPLKDTFAFYVFPIPDIHLGKCVEHCPASLLLSKADWRGRGGSIQHSPLQDKLTSRYQILLPKGAWLPQEKLREYVYACHFYQRNNNSFRRNTTTIRGLCSLLFK